MLSCMCIRLATRLWLLFNKFAEAHLAVVKQPIGYGLAGRCCALEVEVGQGKSRLIDLPARNQQHKMASGGAVGVDTFVDQFVNALILFRAGEVALDTGEGYFGWKRGYQVGIRLKPRH